MQTLCRVGICWFGRFVVEELPLRVVAQYRVGVRFLSRLGWLVSGGGLVCLLFWACTLQGNECRGNEDCDALRVCRNGWCEFDEEESQGESRPEPSSEPGLACRMDGGTSREPESFSRNHGNLGVAASDGVHLYWTDTERGLVARRPIEGGPAEILRGGLQGVFGIAVDRSFVFVGIRSTLERTGSLIRLGKETKQQAKILAKGIQNPESLVLDEDYVYWNSLGPVDDTEGGRVIRVRKEGGELEVLAKPFRPSRLAMDREALYWMTSFSEGAIWKRDHKTGRTSLVVDGIRFGSDLALDDEFVYYLSRGSLWRVRKGGRRLQRVSLPTAQSFVVDRQYLFLVTLEGVLRFPKLCFPSQGESFVSFEGYGLVRQVFVDETRLFFFVQNGGSSSSDIYTIVK